MNAVDVDVPTIIQFSRNHLLNQSKFNGFLVFIFFVSSVCQSVVIRFILSLCSFDP